MSFGLMAGGKKRGHHFLFYTRARRLGVKGECNLETFSPRTRSDREQNRPPTQRQLNLGALEVLTVSGMGGGQHRILGNRLGGGKIGL